MPLPHVIGQRARLREVGNVGRIARIHGNGQAAFEFLVTNVLDGDARGFLESLHGLGKEEVIGVGEGPIHGHSLARVRTGEGFLQLPARHDGEGDLLGGLRRGFGGRGGFRSRGGLGGSGCCGRLLSGRLGGFAAAAGRQCQRQHGHEQHNEKPFGYVHGCVSS